MSLILPYVTMDEVPSDRNADSLEAAKLLDLRVELLQGKRRRKQINCYAEGVATDGAGFLRRLDGVVLTAVSAGDDKRDANEVAELLQEIDKLRLDSLLLTVLAPELGSLEVFS